MEKQNTMDNEATANQQLHKTQDLLMDKVTITKTDYGYICTPACEHHKHGRCVIKNSTNGRLEDHGRCVGAGNCKELIKEEK